MVKSLWLWGSNSTGLKSGVGSRGLGLMKSGGDGCRNKFGMTKWRLWYHFAKIIAIPTGLLLPALQGSQWQDHAGNLDLRRLRTRRLQRLRLRSLRLQNRSKTLRPWNGNIPVTRCLQRLHRRPRFTTSVYVLRGQSCEVFGSEWVWLSYKTYWKEI